MLLLHILIDFKLIMHVIVDWNLGPKSVVVVYLSFLCRFQMACSVSVMICFNLIVAIDHSKYLFICNDVLCVLLKSTSFFPSLMKWTTTMFLILCIFFSASNFCDIYSWLILDTCTFSEFLKKVISNAKILIFGHALLTW